MRNFLKQLGQRLGWAGMPDTTGGQDNAPAAQGHAPGIDDTGPELPPDELDYIMAREYYRRDGQFADGTPKWQLRRRMAVRIRTDMWQVREIHTLLAAPPTLDAEHPEPPVDILKNEITDMVDNLESALALLKAFENALDEDDWLPSAASPEHPTRADVRAALSARPLQNAAE